MEIRPELPAHRLGNQPVCLALTGTCLTCTDAVKGAVRSIYTRILPPHAKHFYSKGLFPSEIPVPGVSFAMLGAAFSARTALTSAAVTSFPELPRELRIIPPGFGMGLVMTSQESLV